MAKRRRLEKFTEEELDAFLTAPNTRGLESIIRFAAADLAAKEDITSPDVMSPDVMSGESLSPDRTAPDKTSPVISSPVVLVAQPADIPSPDRTSGDKTSPDITSPGDPELAAFLASTPAVRSRPYQVHRCVYAQDGHSTSEEAIYQVIWRAARPIRPDDAYRLAQISQNELAARVRMTTRNLRPALQRLEEKLAIEEIRSFDRGAKTARIWKIFSYRSILQRRQAAGMEWVVRDKGVRFVDAPQDKPSPDITSPDVLSLPITSPDKPSGATGDITSGSSPDKTSPLTLLGFSSRKRFEGTTTSATVVEALREVTGHADDEAALRIIRACRQQAHDATDHEIAYFVRTQGERIGRMRGIDNPVGLLIRQVPRCFEGEAFRQYREAERRRREEEEQRDRELCQAILADPDASQQEREWARQALEKQKA
jgi:hypothetical protein